MQLFFCTRNEVQSGEKRLYINYLGWTVISVENISKKDKKIPFTHIQEL